MTVYGVSDNAEPYVGIRSRLGQFRLCYESALAQAPEVSGVWVATVEQGREWGVCTVEVSFQKEQEPSNCFAEVLRNWSQVRTTGRFHIAVSYHHR